MRKLVLGDYDTLIGAEAKPSKITWLMEQGVENIEGIQIISLAQDMLPRNLLAYHKKLFALVDKFSFLKRVSVALLCWPLVTTKKENINIDVAASTFLSADLFFYALGICRALQKVHDEIGIVVDISYHPMQTWPTVDLNRLKMNWHQEFLRRWELNQRAFLVSLLEEYGISDVGINIENEPFTSDPSGNLTHTGNRLFSEQIRDLPEKWGITGDLQHLAMILARLQDSRGYYLAEPLFYPEISSKKLWSWEAQFHLLQNFPGQITLHVAQAENPMRHIKSRIDFSNTKLMPWPLILRLMKDLDKARSGNVWYGIEEDDAHLFPEGYQKDRDALLYLQEYFGK